MENRKQDIQLKVVDLGVGMAAGVVAHTFSLLGADLVRLEPPGGDPFYGVYPAYPIWRQGETLITRGELEAQLKDADVCIIGGESYPGLAWQFDGERLRAGNPALVVIDLKGYVTADAAGRPAVDLLVQARTGLVNEQVADRPIAMGSSLPSYGAALLGLIGAYGALIEREKTGLGQYLQASMQQGVAMWMEGVWSAAEKPDAGFLACTPRGAKQSVWRCKDGKYVVSVFGVPGSLAGTYRALDIDREVDPNDRFLPDMRRGLRNYFADRDLLEPAFARQTRDQVLPRLWKAKVPAMAVLEPGEAWDDEQVKANPVIERNGEGWRYAGFPVAMKFHDAAGNAKGSKTQRKGSAGPLAGYRVLDLGQWVAGPFGGKLLADLGAEVIKVEPVSGDPVRAMARIFASSNRGKSNIAIDLKSPEGYEQLAKLCGSADVLMHNYRVGVEGRLGIDPASLRKINPSLITQHATAFGLHGAMASNSGFDPVTQPFTGHALRLGGKGNDPDIYNVAVLDYAVGAISALAILHALLVRERTGRVAEMSGSLLNAGIYLMSELVQSPDGRFEGAPLLNSTRTGYCESERLFEAADGWIAVCARTPEMKASLLGVLDLDLDPAADWSEADGAKIAAAIRQRASRALLQQLQDAGVWAEPCEADGWKALLENGSARELAIVDEGVDSHYGLTSAVGPLLSFNSSVRTGLAAVARLGQDTDSLLSEAGVPPSDIESLRSQGVIA